jgi:oligopeptide/dipeptide ABC transporter ATP-binding protein
MPPILEVKNLVTKFHAIDGIVNAVNGVSFTLEEGETLAIVGESGSGKSVSMMSILGLLPSPPAKVESGEAIFHCEKGAVDLLKLPYEEMSDMRGGRIGFIFQDPGTSLNPILTVGEQITESLTRHLGLDSQQARRRAIDLLADVGIPDPELRFSAYPFQLSGGMRQRVMIAIAVACSPSIVIADEPTTALDVTIQAQIVSLFKELRKRMGVSTIWITHDLGLVAGLADRVLVMYAGKIMESAPVDNLYENPQHPYTVGLLGALPRLDTDETRRLVSIEGAPPDSTIPIQHCPFAWRCTRAFERCWQEAPALLDVEKNHQAACFAVSGKGG